MFETKHVKINTTIDYPGFPSSLEKACKELETSGWSLQRVIYHHQYESIAIFERNIPEEVSTDTLDEDKYWKCCGLTRDSYRQELDEQSDRNFTGALDTWEW